MFRTQAQSDISQTKLVSFTTIIRVVMQRFSPQKHCMRTPMTAAKQTRTKRMLVSCVICSFYYSSEVHSTKHGYRYQDPFTCEQWMLPSSFKLEFWPCSMGWAFAVLLQLHCGDLYNLIPPCGIWNIFSKFMYNKCHWGDGGAWKWQSHNSEVHRIWVSVVK